MNHRRGSILILVLIVLVVLGLYAVSFAYRAGLESRTAKHFAIAAQLKAHACSAAAIATARLMENTNGFDHPAEAWHTHNRLSEEQWLPEWSDNQRGWPPAFATDYQVIDEEGKLNIVIASSEALEKLGMSDSQIACLLDWMDADNVAQADGAEDGYYQALADPYRCKNAPLELLHELLLIRGFDPGTYYGEDTNHDGVMDPCENDGDVTGPHDNADGELQLGWVDLLTCLGDGRINLNTAPAAVLQTLPLSDGAVAQIIGFRAFDKDSSGNLDDHAFRSAADIDQLQGLTETDRDILRSMGRFDSTHFRIFVRSTHTETGMQYRLEVLVRINGDRPEFLEWKTGR